MTMGVGLLGYGLSLVFFVRALRELGTSRIGAYFSTAPFVGAAVSIVMLGEPTPAPFWIAAVLMGVGVWLHLTGTHEHIHDEHHQHSHDPGWDGRGAHTHLHHQHGH